MLSGHFTRNLMWLFSWALKYCNDVRAGTKNKTAKNKLGDKAVSCIPVWHSNQEANLDGSLLLSSTGACTTIVN